MERVERDVPASRVVTADETHAALDSSVATQQGERPSPRVTTPQLRDEASAGNAPVDVARGASIREQLPTIASTRDVAPDELRPHRELPAAADADLPRSSSPVVRAHSIETTTWARRTTEHVHTAPLERPLPADTPPSRVAPPLTAGKIMPSRAEPPKADTGAGGDAPTDAPERIELQPNAVRVHVLPAPVVHRAAAHTVTLAPGDDELDARRRDPVVRPSLVDEMPIAAAPAVEHDAPTTIHVTIGRVEVTTPAPPARRGRSARRAATAPPLAPRISLDSYLSGRSGRREPGQLARLSPLPPSRRYSRISSTTG
jgi:hypothetical protein